MSALQSTAEGAGMRILVVGDTHGVLEWVQQDVIPMAHKHNCTRIMQLGDFQFVWGKDILAAPWGLMALNEALEAAGLELHFLPGNHEHHYMLELIASWSQTTAEGHKQLTDNIFYTGRVSAWIWDGVHMAAVGGAASIDKPMLTPGVDWWPEELLTEAEAAHAKTLGPVDILFTHDSPPDIPMQLYEHPEGDMHRQRIGDIAQALRPREWFHGHYHQHLRYTFRHPDGVCRVTGLDCYWSPRRRAMAVIDTADYR